jgi:hypothetical protein
MNNNKDDILFPSYGSFDVARGVDRQIESMRTMRSMDNDAQDLYNYEDNSTDTKATTSTISSTLTSTRIVPNSNQIQVPVVLQKQPAMAALPANQQVNDDHSHLHLDHDASFFRFFLLSNGPPQVMLVVICLAVGLGSSLGVVGFIHNVKPCPIL